MLKQYIEDLACRWYVSATITKKSMKEEECDGLLLKSSIARTNRFEQRFVKDVSWVRRKQFAGNGKEHTILIW